MKVDVDEVVFFALAPTHDDDADLELAVEEDSEGWVLGTVRAAARALVLPSLGNVIEHHKAVRGHAFLKKPLRLRLVIHGRAELGHI